SIPQSTHVLKTLQAIAYCRTRYMGGHKSGCKHCGTVKYHYNSCRNRHCTKCQSTNRERWILQREAELLPVPYYHIVFTLPHDLNELAIQYPKQVYDALFTAAWQTIKTFASDPDYIGAKTSMTAILHTWGQGLWLHPHLHCIVPGGGLLATGKWKSARCQGKYLFPKKALSSPFRAKYVKALRKSGVVIPQSVGKKLFSKSWVVYAKKPFMSPSTVVEYLGRYTHKVAISNHRLKSVNDHEVSFTYKDYR
ncbi:MAG: transposase, partial [Bacteroidetes bacterium]|nr:transposase [Bacteroidota bacterium]